ncbi:hypothetical protein D0C36_17485 [Mucilaginibacter conchicola]|uniref:Uncharacterized protein n=1 Tax=Mucilaginibacter conchicola TaxID=2303333 RepID=A0A372NP72_9SPHI|nr:hypothetical protein [Mucilaginibacter conchicola]RFZ90749.1 hypothetical protein D0C36_17485 [Mucilaginibacter conchicola]
MQTALSPYNLLLQTYRDGLAIGLFSKDEVVAWADELIIKSDEPDHSLIEISLSTDKNQLISVLNEITNTTADEDNDIATRALLGVIYKRYKADEVDIRVILDSIEMLPCYKLSDYEKYQAFLLEDHEFTYGPEQQVNLRLDIIRFLEPYQSLSLDKYQYWQQINNELIAEMAYKETQQCIHQPYKLVMASPKKVAIKKISFVFILVSLVILTFGVLLLTGNLTNSDGTPLYTPGALLIWMAITVYRQSTGKE